MARAAGGADLSVRCAHTDVATTVGWRYQPEPDVVPLSRARLRAVLAEWGLAGEALDDVLLVGTEIVANAVDHARTPFGLTATVRDGEVVLQVRDYSRRPPRMRPLDGAAARGRGLQLVDAIAARWGVRVHPRGKTVWACVRTR